MAAAFKDAMGTVRGGVVLIGFFALTLPLMPVQAVLVRFWPRQARRFPHWYHRQVCRILAIRIEIDGDVVRDRPVLLVANHTSWLDIPVLSAVAPVSFVAKKEVAGWPFVSALARLQRSVFVDRARRSAVGQAAGEIVTRLAQGDTVVLFAEGTSSDGNRVLPFMTSLFAAAKPSAKAGGDEAADAVVQPLSLVYTRLHGIPLGRADRPLVGWYGDMEMRGHAWRLLKSGPLDVRIRVGAPVPLADFADRKELARHSESEVREHVIRILRGRDSSEQVAIAASPSDGAARRPRSSEESSAKWV
jgi:lyso-ornithine lipid O-acyltransferase